MRFYVLIGIAVLLAACTNQSTPTPSKKESTIVLPQPSNYQFQTFKNKDGTWGYTISKGDKSFINQPYIPAISGKKGFVDEEKARITAMFVLSKLEEGQQFPTINRKELDSLKVLE